VPQINPNPQSLLLRRLNDFERRLHALELTVPLPKDSAFNSTPFNMIDETWVPDPGVTIPAINCFGTPTEGTAVQVIGACFVGLPFTPAGGSVGAEIGVQVDGGTTYEPGSGPGIYWLAQVDITNLTNTLLSISIAGVRDIEILSPANTQGLSTHAFSLTLRSIYGEDIYFNTRSLVIDPS
jgi:hypothetical protein